jgi:hypothetical protein
LANVSISDVRDTINVGDADIPDAKLQKMVKRAEVTLELELGKEIDYADCTEAEKEFITLLAAIYAICYLTGGSAVGLSFSVGDQNVSATEKAPPLGDGRWHRTNPAESTIFDDAIAYTLLGLYNHEGWSSTVQKAYAFVNAIGPSPTHPAYNPAICWAGYINVTARIPACDYYDNVTAGILSQIRRDRDKSAYEFSEKIISNHPDEFMFWGAKHADYSFVENKQAMATVCWLAQLLLSYEPPVTRFMQILSSKGENLTLHPVTEAGERTAYGDGIDVKAIVLPAKAEEVLLEPGYVTNDYLTLHVFAPVRRRDKIRRNGEDYEILSVQEFTFKGDTAFRKVTCRRLIRQ